MQTKRHHAPPIDSITLHYTNAPPFHHTHISTVYFLSRTNIHAANRAHTRARARAASLSLAPPSPAPPPSTFRSCSPPLSRSPARSLTLFPRARALTLSFFSHSCSPSLPSSLSLFLLSSFSLFLCLPLSLSLSLSRLLSHSLTCSRLRFLRSLYLSLSLSLSLSFTR